MSPEQCHPDDPLVQHLQAMPLAVPAVNRDRLCFLAGQAHGKRRGRMLGAVAMVILCVGMGTGVLVGRWTGPERVKIVFLKQNPDSAPKEAAQVKPKVVNVAVSPDVVPKTQAAKVVVDLSSAAGWQKLLLAADPDLLLSQSGPPPLPYQGAPLPSTKTESVEDLLGIPPGSLNVNEREDWSKALHLGAKL